MKHTRGVVSNVVLGTIGGIVAIIGTAFAVSVQFVSKATFSEFKEGTIAHIEKRMDGIDSKLDRIIEEQRIRK